MEGGRLTEKLADLPDGWYALAEYEHDVVPTWRVVPIFVPFLRSVLPFASSLNDPAYRFPPSFPGPPTTEKPAS